MSETIHVEVACPADAADFVEFLADRGLTARVATANDHCDIDVGVSRARLKGEFEDALRGWLEHNDRLVPITTAEHAYVLRPPAG